MKPDDSLITELRNARINKGLTQAEVAKSLGITAQAISNFERGRNNLSRHYLDQLCKLYDINPVTFVKQSDIHETEAIIDALVKSSRALPAELRAPVERCQSTYITAIDGILRKYNFCKDRQEINQSIAEFYRNFEPDSDSSIELIRDYELHIQLSDTGSLLEEATAKANERMSKALATLSKELQALLEKSAQDALSSFPSEA